MPTLDATLAGDQANSYVDMAWADAYADNTTWAGEWAAGSLDDRTIALIKATQWLETMPFNGSRCSATQRLSWPRKDAKCDGVTSDCTAIPYRIMAAEVELAYQFLKDPTAINGGGGNSAPSGTYVSQQQLGDLSISYAEYRNNTGSVRDDSDQPALIATYPWIGDLIGCYTNIISSGSGRVLTRECCNPPGPYIITM